MPNANRSATDGAAANRHCRRLLVVTSLVVVVGVGGCPAEDTGRTLCSSADTVRRCGIEIDACNDALSADPAFVVDDIYDPPAVVLGEGNRCLLDTVDRGSSVVTFGPSTPVVAREFDVGEALPTSELMKDLDSDGDGVTNGDEVALGSDPLLTDSDGDGILDGAEVDEGLDPAAADSDGDGVDDLAELERGTDPTVADTDGDGDDDGVEAACGSSPLDPAFVCAAHDSDGDGLSDVDEATRGTDPADADSDDDGVVDGDEIAIGTDPLAADSDGDGLVDGDEVANGTNPAAADTDGDGVSDGDERTRGTDPADADTDDDGDSDGAELACSSSPLDPAFTCANPPAP